VVRGARARTFLARSHAFYTRSAKKEAKRLEKEAKLAAKSQKTVVAAVTSDKKAKADKAKKEEEPAFVNTTPKGEKKGSCALNCAPCSAGGQRG
jgi:hypothetical protein